MDVKLERLRGIVKQVSSIRHSIKQIFRFVPFPSTQSINSLKLFELFSTLLLLFFLSSFHKVETLLAAKC